MLFSVLAEAELPVICVETRHMQAVLKAQIDETDRRQPTCWCTRCCRETCATDGP